MSSIDRRSFLRAAGGMAAASVLSPERILADPYRPWSRALPPASPVRIRGRVQARGGGVPGVRVSDGLAVALTDPEGRYELVSDTARDFVFVGVPRGYSIPTNPTGTARFHRRIQPDGRGEMDASFQLEALRGSDERHTLLWLPDIQTQDQWEMDRFHEQSVPDVRRTVEGLDSTVVFGMAGGDIMYDDLSLYPEYERGVRRMGVPFFQVVGNHDLDFDGSVDEETTRTFSRHFGPRYYSFDRGAVHYVVLDDVFYHGQGYIGYLQEEQLRWLEADLATVESGTPVVVGLHIPVASTPRFAEAAPGRPGPTVSLTNREALYRLLDPFDAHVLSGHTHENHHNHADGVHEHVSGTVCGAWWSGPICGDGTPNGYSVYEIHGEEVTWRYKATGNAPEHQMRVYVAGSDPGAPQEVVANVWDADDDWVVVWYEDGEPRGRMSRRLGLDPVSRAIHTGEDLPPRRGWVEPYPRYLYFAPVSPDAHEVRVEATDRFGRVYSRVAQPVPDMNAWDREDGRRPDPRPGPALSGMTSGR